MKYVLLICLFFSSIYVYSLSGIIRNLSVYNTALGGPHTAMAEGFDTFFNNPALLSEYEEGFSVLNFETHIMGNDFTIIELGLGGKLDFGNPTNLLKTLRAKKLTNFLVRIAVLGPISIGYIGKNWGWNIKNYLDAYVKLPSLVSDLKVFVQEDFVLAGGIALPFTLYNSGSNTITLTLGVIPRGVMRVELDIECGLIEALSLITDLSKLLASYPLQTTPMFAIDGGFIFKFNNILSLSGVVRDFYTTLKKYDVTTLQGILGAFTSNQGVDNGVLYREVNIGLGVDIPIRGYSVIVSDLNFYLDYYDVFLSEKAPLLHLGLGMDIELLEQFHILAGLNEGVLSLGVSVNTKGFNLGFSVYGSGGDSIGGKKSVLNAMFSIGIIF